MNLPAGLAVGAADFMADHVFSRIDIPGWMARTGFQLLDPIKTAQSRFDFVRQLHDREALLPREQQRRFLVSDGYIAWSGPAIAELLKQFIAHNRMMSGGFSIRGDLVTLSDIDCPILAIVGEVDDIGQPAAVRGIKRAAPQADVYEHLIRAGHFGLVVGSKAANQNWPTVAGWVNWIDGTGELPDSVVPMALQPAETGDSGVPFASRVAHSAAAATEMTFTLARTAADALFAANKSARALVAETARTLPRLARLGQINDHTRISLGRIMGEQADCDAGRRVPAVRRAGPHLRGGGPPHQQRRARPHRRRRPAGRPRRRVDGDEAQRARRHRRAVTPWRGGRADAARRRPRRSGPNRRCLRRHR